MLNYVCLGLVYYLYLVVVCCWLCCLIVIVRFAFLNVNVAAWMIVLVVWYFWFVWLVVVCGLLICLIIVLYSFSLFYCCLVIKLFECVGCLFVCVVVWVECMVICFWRWLWLYVVWVWLIWCWCCFPLRVCWVCLWFVCYLVAACYLLVY